jgi:hypothetical protein
MLSLKGRESCSHALSPFSPTCVCPLSCVNPCDSVVPPLLIFDLGPTPELASVVFGPALQYRSYPGKYRQNTLNLALVEHCPLECST